jgi:hypothetical protein
MKSIRDIPEIQGLETRRQLIRIPPEMDVPMTPRVRQIVDTVEFQRLAKISQLGLVSLVYPAAHHSRFEHCLGTYRTALLYLKQLSYDDRFSEAIQSQDAELLIVAALLHDLGHWPTLFAMIGEFNRVMSWLSFRKNLATKNLEFCRASCRDQSTSTRWTTWLEIVFMPEFPMGETSISKD